MVCVLVVAHMVVADGTACHRRGRFDHNNRPKFYVKARYKRNSVWLGQRTQSCANLTNVSCSRFFIYKEVRRIEIEPPSQWDDSGLEVRGKHWGELVLGLHFYRFLETGPTMQPGTGIAITSGNLILLRFLIPQPQDLGLGVISSQTRHFVKDQLIVLDDTSKANIMATLTQ